MDARNNATHVMRDVTRHRCGRCGACGAGRRWTHLSTMLPLLMRVDQALELVILVALDHHLNGFVWKSNTKQVAVHRPTVTAGNT